jgi:hypothetical protein
MSPDLSLRTTDVAALFDVSASAVRRWAASGLITCERGKDGRRYSASHAACLLARGEPGSLVRIADVDPGDVVLYDGDPVQVTGMPWGWYFDGGRREGTAIRWRRGTAQGVFTRAGSDTIVRLRAAGRRYAVA